MHARMQADPVGCMEVDVVWDELPVTAAHPAQLLVGDAATCLHACVRVGALAGRCLAHMPMP